MWLGPLLRRDVGIYRRLRLAEVRLIVIVHDLAKSCYSLIMIVCLELSLYELS